MYCGRLVVSLVSMIVKRSKNLSFQNLRLRLTFGTIIMCSQTSVKVCIFLTDGSTAKVFPRCLIRICGCSASGRSTSGAAHHLFGISSMLLLCETLNG